MLCPPTSSQAVLEEKMNVWGMLIWKTTLGGNSSQPTYLLLLPFRIDMSQNILWSDLLQRLDYHITDKYRS